MGLSKKLGNVANQRGLQPEYLSVEYKWSTQSYTIQDIMDKFKLPCVVQCATDQCSILWSKFQFDLRHPLLLYSRRTVRKVYAQNLTTSTQEDFGPPVTMPEDYEGWFGATPKGTSQTKRHTRIEGIANSNTLRFLVTTKCPAFTRSSGQDGSLEYISRDIVPGETFKRVCIMEGDIDDPDTPDIVQFNGPCMECLDEKDDDVLIPLSRRAIAYEISEFYPNENHKVFNVKQMISAGNSKLPRIVSLVCGERPVLDYTFTGLLRCFSVFTEETVLAATLDDTSPVCLEMTTDSCARFKLSLNEAAIKRTCEYNNALQLCKTSGDAFLMGIKVSFSVQPEPEKEENDASTFDMQSNVSDMQEVDANSEFEIAWSSEQNTNSSKSSFEKGDVSMTDNFILLNNDSRQVPMKEAQDKSETRLRRPLPDIGKEHEPDPPADFTEQEIADLMVRKGMLQALGTSSSSDLNLTEEIETLRRTRVKVNPIYFCKEPVSESNNDLHKLTEPDYSEIDDLAVNSAADDEENCDVVEVSLHESEFGSAVCTRASEYHSDSEGEESDVELNGETTTGAKEDCIQEVKKTDEITNELPVGVSTVTSEESTCHTEKDSVIKPEVLEIQTVQRTISGDIPTTSTSVEFFHGLNVSHKSTSSDMMNKKKWWSPKRKGEGSSIINKFKSESNISKIFDRLKGTDDEKSISSSKTKLLQLKSSVKSSSTKKDTCDKSEDNESFEVIEC